MEGHRERTAPAGSANELIEALAALGQHLLELQGVVADVGQAAAEDPDALQVLRESRQRVADMHLRAWAGTAGSGTARTQGPSPARTGERSAP